MTTPDIRVAVVTGASSGIGKETAKALAGQGWRIIALGRDPARSAAADVEIRAASIGQSVDMIVADLALLSEARRVAQAIAALTDRIDVLFNNAGGIAVDQRITAEGHEGTFAGNHLGPFVLTEALLPLLRNTARERPSGAVRIITTSSSAHEYSQGFDWDDLELLDHYQSGAAYCNVKLANILFTRALARRVEKDGIVAHAMHPGTVDSNFASHGDAMLKARMAAHDLRPPSEAADTLIWLASADSPGRSTGLYYHRREAIPAAPLALDEALADRLWARSEALVAATQA